MNIVLASKIIDRFGGTKAMAELCEVSMPSVSQWRNNGIPKARIMFLRERHPEIFRELQE